MLKRLPVLLRFVLGSIFLFYGLDGFFHFMPAKIVSEQAGDFITALIDSGYLWTLLKAAETVGGFMLLSNFYVPLALVLLAPIVVNIFGFHLFMNPAGWAIGIYPVGVTIVVAELVLAWFYREYFQGLFVRSANARIPQLESSSANDSSITSIADQIKIIQLMNQFGMALDLRDWESFRRLFTDSVKFDYSSISEVAGTLHPDDLVNRARKDLGGFQATQHMITNHLVELANNEATCYAHVRAYHFLPNDQGESMLEMGGYYTAGLVRTEEDWKIHSWKFSVLWTHGNQELFDIGRKSS